MNNLGQEPSNQALVDALKYTSDIIVTLTDKINNQDLKINFLEKTIIEQKNIISKNQNDILELNKKMSLTEKKLLLFINKEILTSKSQSVLNDNVDIKELKNKENQKNNLEFEFLTQTINDLSSGLGIDGLNQIEELDEIDLETINNTLCNTTMVSDVTSFNNEDIELIKKQKATSIVENLIRRKQELEKKINGVNNQSNQPNQPNQNNLTNTSKILIDTGKSTEQNNDNKPSQDINAIRRKKNFARKF